jgi:hypothetical protein
MNLSRRQIFNMGAGLLADGPVFAAQDRNSSASQSEPAAEPVMEMPFELCDPVRFGIIGVGNRGSLMLDLLLSIPHACARRARFRLRTGGVRVTGISGDSPLNHLRRASARSERLGRLQARGDVGR